MKLSLGYVTPIRQYDMSQNAQNQCNTKPDGKKAFQQKKKQLGVKSTRNEIKMMPKTIAK